MNIAKLINKFGTAEILVKITSEEARRVVTLLERDEKALAVQKNFTSEEHKGRHYYICPKCNTPLVSNAKFCSECGQRINENEIAF